MTYACVNDSEVDVGIRMYRPQYLRTKSNSTQNAIEANSEMANSYSSRIDRIPLIIQFSRYNCDILRAPSDVIYIVSNDGAAAMEKKHNFVHVYLHYQ